MLTMILLRIKRIIRFIKLLREDKVSENWLKQNTHYWSNRRNGR
jgi:hypothetical protein